jgi:serine/threonine-protein kinase
MSRTDESLAESIRSLELDPLDLTINHHLGWHYRLARQYDQAISQLRMTLEMDANQLMTHVYLGQAYLQNGMHSDAIQAFERAIELGGRGHAHDFTWLGHAHAVAGNPAQARQVLDLLKRNRSKIYTSAYSIALIHTGLGENEQALEWLERAYEERNPLLVYLKVEPDMDELRSETGFVSILRRMGLV